MNETVLVIALAFAGAIGSPLIEGIKKIAELMGVAIVDRAALWLTLAVSVLLAFAAMAAAGVFAPPYPETIVGWVTLVGGSVSAVLGIATVVFRQLIKPSKMKVKS